MGQAIIDYYSKCIHTPLSHLMASPKFDPPFTQLNVRIDAERKMTGLDGLSDILLALCVPNINDQSLLLFLLCFSLNNDKQLTNITKPLLLQR